MQLIGFCVALTWNSVGIPGGFGGQCRVFRENLGCGVVYVRCANTQPFLCNELGPFQAI